jgi:large subunit ribosomal protein L23
MLNLSDLLNLIKYPSLTEKSINLYGNSQYTFIVDRSLTKTQAKYVLENIFNVKIVSINSCNLPLKARRVGKYIGNRSRYKKVYIKLKAGDRIADLFN